jgi:TonB-dependent Receptor Plug Domain
VVILCWPSLALAVPVSLQVRDRASGDPVADVIVQAADQQAVTDPTGAATLELAEPGPWTVSVVSEDFKPTQVTVTPPAEDPVRVWLERGAFEYEIVVEGLKVTADPTRHTVDGEMATKTAGTLDDSVRLVQSLPGVTVQREYSPSSGELSVRGSSAGDSRYYVDGVEIPYLYHYNQYASVFPAAQVDRLELFPSTFSAHYGDSVGAIVEATTRLEPPKAIHGSASLNFVMGGAEISAPVAGKWWLTASGRRSYQDLAGESSAQYTVWPTFHDFLVRAEHGDEEGGTGLFVLGAGDRYTRAAGELDLLDPYEGATTPYLAFRQAFEVLGARTRWAHGTTKGRWVAAVVHHRRAADLAGLGLEELDSGTLTSRLDATGRAPGALGWDAGYEFNLQRASLVVVPAGDDGLRVAEEAPWLARGTAVDDVMWRARGGAYGTLYARFGSVTVLPGLRVDADSTFGEVQLQPRAAVRRGLGDTTMLKAGGGRYTQRPETETLLPGSGDPNLPTTRSWQVTAGVEQAFAGRWEVGLDLYRKWLQDPLLYPIDAVPYAAPRGDAYGAELVTRYRLRERFFLWGWLALQRTTLEDLDGETVPADGDQAVSGGVVVSYDAGGWNFGGRYRYASGLPFTPLEGSLYDAGNDRWIPLPGELNSDRLPAYHKIDVRAEHTWQLRGWSVSLAFEVWYVPKPSTQLYPTWNYDYTEQGWVTGPTLLPLAGARARF